MDYNFCGHNGKKKEKRLILWMLGMFRLHQSMRKPKKIIKIKRIHILQCIRFLLVLSL